MQEAKRFSSEEFEEKVNLKISQGWRVEYMCSATPSYNCSTPSIFVIFTKDTKNENNQNMRI